jgi:signal transduction histidine kinase
MAQNSAIQTTLRILHLEDSDVDHSLVRRSLERSGETFELHRVESLVGFADKLTSDHYDVVLADYRLAGFTALDAWHLLQKHPEPPPFILLSGAIGESAAVSAIKLGISDYLSKDEINRVPAAIRRVLEIQAMRHQKEAADVELAQSRQRLADFAEHLQSTIEQERAAIAREIHDDIGGALAAVRFDLSWLDRHASDLPTKQHVQSAEEMLRHAMDASQRIMRNLRPAILDQGLTAAVEWLAESFSKRTGIKTIVQTFTDDQRIPKAIQLVAYRTAQEALTNVSKHSQCDQVTLELSDAEQVLTLEVRDNGQGISPKELGKSQSFGLRGLQERARTVDGWLDISSYGDRGVSIILSVPLPSQQLSVNKECD